MVIAAIGVSAFATTSPTKHSTEYLTEYVIGQKDAGTLDQNDPLYLELIAREGVRLQHDGSPRLDQGGSSCATAVAIGSLPYNDTGTLVGETDDCVGRPYFDVFYSYTATVAGPHIFNMCGALSSGDTYIRVWTAGTCCAGASTTGDDNCSIGGVDGTVTVTLSVGQLVYAECGYYYIDGIGGGGIGTYEFHVSGPPPPTGRCCYGTDPCNPDCRDGVTPTECTSLGGTYVAGAACPCPLPLAGDHCCNALPLTVPGSNAGSTVGYTNSGDANCGGTGAPDVVYYYTPAVNQIVTFTTCDAGTSYDTKLWITEAPCATGTLIDCNDDAGSVCGSGGLKSILSCIPLTAGVTYYIFADGFSSGSGAYVLNTFINSSSSDGGLDASHGYPQYTCWNFCAEQNVPASFTISGAIRDAAMPPIISILPGCRAGVVGCDEDCTPSADAVIGPWVYGPEGVWTATASGFGCICVTFEGYLGVELNSFSAIAGNNNVTLNWATASETNNDRFELVRDGNVVAQVPSLGNSSGHNYSWTDGDVANGRTYSYNLVSVDVNGLREELATETATPRVNGAMANEYTLAQNFPNPFNPTTEIAFNILEAGVVTLKVYNLVGQEVATLVNGSLEAGTHTVAFDAANLTSGIYLYRLEAGSFAAEKKMVLMK
jgi:hypothetical protein